MQPPTCHPYISTVLIPIVRKTSRDRTTSIVTCETFTLSTRDLRARRALLVVVASWHRERTITFEGVGKIYWGSGHVHCSEEQSMGGMCYCGRRYFDFLSVTRAFCDVLYLLRLQSSAGRDYCASTSVLIL